MGIDESACREEQLRPLSSPEIAEFAREIPAWTLRAGEMERELQFRDFREAMEFVNQVAFLAEAEGHHPDIFISYNRVRLTLSTHKVKALSCRDFLLALKIDRLREGNG